MVCCGVIRLTYLYQKPPSLPETDAEEPGLDVVDGLALVPVELHGHRPLRLHTLAVPALPVILHHHRHVIPLRSLHVAVPRPPQHPVSGKKVDFE